MGKTCSKLLAKKHGAKPWIAPVLQEVLVNLDLAISVRAEKWLCDRLLQGLNMDCPLLVIITF